MRVIKNSAKGRVRLILELFVTKLVSGAIEIDLSTFTFLKL